MVPPRAGLADAEVWGLEEDPVQAARIAEIVGSDSPATVARVTNCLLVNLPDLSSSAKWCARSCPTLFEDVISVTLPLALEALSVGPS